MAGRDVNPIWFYLTCLSLGTHCICEAVPTCPTLLERCRKTDCNTKKGSKTDGNLRGRLNLKPRCLNEELYDLRQDVDPFDSLM